MDEYLTFTEVTERLRVSAVTLRRRMQATPDAIDPPWVTIGHGKRATYRFASSKIDDWWFAVNRQ